MVSWAPSAARIEPENMSKIDTSSQRPIPRELFLVNSLLQRAQAGS
jgi:hypothetical protein